LSIADKQERGAAVAAVEADLTTRFSSSKFQPSSCKTLSLFFSFCVCVDPSFPLWTYRLLRAINGVRMLLSSHDKSHFVVVVVDKSLEELKDPGQ
jgi:hypothetical protein